MADDELVRIKGEVSATGGSVELRVGNQAPGALEKIFPRWMARRTATTTISARILSSLNQNGVLDEADLEYASAVFGEAEAKWMRRKAIAERAAAALPELTPPHALPAPASDSNDSEAAREPEQVAEPADDWLNQFWEDAGLVSDEMMQEIYGRILASEALKPGSCSRRTLAVLRSLDRETAESFARVARLVMDSWIPTDGDILKLADVNVGTLLALDDMGLLDSRTMLVTAIPSDEATFYRWNDRVVAVSRANGSQLSVYPLTRAGRDLSRIADVQFRLTDFTTILGWMNRSIKKSGELAWAVLPHRHWEGKVTALNWTSVARTSKKS